LENTLYIWKYFVLNIRADFSCPPPKKKLFCSPMAKLDITPALEFANQYNLKKSFKSTAILSSFVKETGNDWFANNVLTIKQIHS